MCGITGWLGFHHDLRNERHVIDEMTATMTRRGPDDCGVFIDTHIGLGHRRLAIIDLPLGHQPMTVETPDGVVAIVYSGETYNYRELRTELRSRGIISSPTPTPRWCCTAIWSGVHTSPITSTVCSPSRSGTAVPMS